jgi:hypothetical protein
MSSFLPSLPDDTMVQGGADPRLERMKRDVNKGSDVIIAPRRDDGSFLP